VAMQDKHHAETSRTLPAGWLPLSAVVY